MFLSTHVPLFYFLVAQKMVFVIGVGVREFWLTVEEEAEAEAQNDWWRKRNGQRKRNGFKEF